MHPTPAGQSFGLWGAQAGCRCHVELNENKPYEFVGEDIILPQEIRLKPYNTK